MLMLLFIAAAVAQSIPREPIIDPVRYRVELRADFETTLPPGRALPGVEPDVLMGRDLLMTIELGLVRRFRDGSRGELLRFVDVQDTARQGGVSEVLVPAPLEGRSVELRRFDSGEVLRVDLAEHIAGGDRAGEIFDLLFEVLSPVPPDLRERAVSTRVVRWPFGVSSRRGATNVLVAEWTHDGMVGKGGDRAFALHYQGPWTTRAFGPKGRGPLPWVEAKGRASGSVQIAKDDLSLVSHEFSWERTVLLRYPKAVGGPLELTQHQVFVGSVERLP